MRVLVRKAQAIREPVDNVTIAIGDIEMSDDLPSRSVVKFSTDLTALDLYCCAGGASRGLVDAGFLVTGVDITYRPHYRHRFLEADVLGLSPSFLRNFDFVWASPPCQRYSDATRQTGTPNDHPDLIGPTRELLRASGVPFVIENVPRAPLDPEHTIMLCGAMFDLGVVRHRCFEFSWLVPQPEHPKHKGSLVTGEYVTVAGNGGVPSWTLKERERRGLPRHRDGEYSLDNWKRAMGIDWTIDRDELVEAIPPAFAEWCGKRAIEYICGVNTRGEVLV